MPALDIKTTLGAILAGGIAAVALSGMAAVQGFLYFRMYPRDPKTVHGLVALVWLLDAVHSTLIAVAIWRYFVLSFDMESQVDLIYPEIAFSVALTAALTFVVHMFFAVRLSRLSKANRYIIAPLVVLALARLGCAIVSTVEMAELRSYHRFLEEWVFTLGLSFSSATDIWIVAAMCFYLHMSRTGLGKMDHVIDILLIYTFNNGALTCVTTIITLICWITMDNLTFLGIHFCIAKLYAMSLLITLNTRRSIRRRAEAPADDIDLNVAINLPSFSVYRTRSITTQHPSSIRHSESVAATQIFLDVGKPARTGGHTAAEEDTREQFDRPGIFPALEKECS